MTEEQIKQKAEKRFEKSNCRTFDEYHNAVNKGCYKQGFIDGYEECQKEYEWHYVKNGDLPKSSDKVVCEDVLEYPFIAWYKNGEWRDESGVLTTDVFKWKEITPPKEIE